MTYKLYCTNYSDIPNAVLKINDDGSMSSFLLGSDNPEEQAYLKWLEEGNTPLPADQIALSPIVSVTMRQARLALLNAGLLDTVNANISTMSKANQIEWEFANDVVRDSPFVAQLSTKLGLTESQLDNLFLAASTL